jgi:hypothetical protein
MAGKPAQSFTHELNATKGWPNLNALDKRANIDPSSAALVNGMVASLNSSKNITAGLGTPSTTNAAMPIFLHHNGADYDVLGDDGNIVGAQSWVSSSQSVYAGVIAGLVATGGYEFETTEFVAGTYNPGDLLMDDTTTHGKLNTLGALSKQNGQVAVTVCGVVSDGKYTNALGISVVAFWPVFLPPVKGIT